MLKSCEVFAFTGPAGTGKSHRATHVARKYDIDYIIDDGLVISHGRIMSGRSAKSERNRLRAVRRALFEFPEHREETKRFLAANPPERLMILATSQRMVLQICERLELPVPVKWIAITEVATPEQIELALKERRTKQQHVVPVARAQIQRGFAGHLVRQIRSFFTRNAHNTIVKPLFSFNGRVVIEPQAIISMSRMLLSNHEDINIRKLELSQFDDDRLEMDAELDITLHDLSALSIARKLQSSLQCLLSYTTGLTVKVNITVNEIYI